MDAGKAWLSHSAFSKIMARLNLPKILIIWMYLVQSDEFTNLYPVPSTKYGESIIFSPVTLNDFIFYSITFYFWMCQCQLFFYQKFENLGGISMCALLDISKLIISYFTWQSTCVVRLKF